MRYEINSQNTKLALSESLKNLVKQRKTTDKITISEICRGCNVNRNTFYYHFPDICQLILWTLHNDFYQQFDTFGSLNGHKIREFTVNYLHRSSKFLNFAYQELGFDIFCDSYIEELYPIILEHIKQLEEQNHMRISPRFKKFIAEFYAEQVGSLYVMQFRRPDRYDDNAAIKCLEMIFDYSIPDMILHQEELDFH